MESKKIELIYKYDPIPPFDDTDNMRTLLDKVKKDGKGRFYQSKVLQR